MTPQEITFNHGDKTYHLKLIDKQMQGDFEQAVYRKKLEKLKSVKDCLTPAEYERKHDRITDDLLNGKFSIMHGGPDNALNDADNGMLLICKMLNVDMEELLALVSDPKLQTEITLAFKAVRKASFPGVKFPDEVEEDPVLLEKKTVCG